MGKGYTSKRLSFARKMAIASMRGNKKNAIHCIAEINVDKPLAFRNESKDKDGKKLSFTGYLVKCLSSTLIEFPEMNSFIRRGRQIILDDITISVLIEREIDGVKIPEPLGLQQCQTKSLDELHDEIRETKANKEALGGLSDTSWVRFIPAFLLRPFIRVADQNITLAKRYGKVAITSVGMYSDNASWFIPHGTATVLLTVGGIQKKRELDDNGMMVEKSYLKLTASFDHELIDGAPAAMFMNVLEKNISSGEEFLRADLH